MLCASFAGRRDPEPALRPDRALCALCGAARRGQHQALPHRQGAPKGAELYCILFFGFRVCKAPPWAVPESCSGMAALVVLRRVTLPQRAATSLLSAQCSTSLLYFVPAQVYRRDQPQMARGRFREFFQCDFGKRF